MRATLLSAPEEHWDVFTDWYEDRLNGVPLDPVLERDRVLIPYREGLWDRAIKEQNPGLVNKRIREIIDAHQRPPPETSPQDQIVEALAADLNGPLLRASPTDIIITIENGKLAARRFAGEDIPGAGGDAAQCLDALRRLGALALAREDNTFSPMLRGQLDAYLTELNAPEPNPRFLTGLAETLRAAAGDETGASGLAPEDRAQLAALVTAHDALMELSAPDAPAADDTLNDTPITDAGPEDMLEPLDAGQTSFDSVDATDAAEPSLIDSAAWLGGQVRQSIEALAFEPNSTRRSRLTAAAKYRTKRYAVFLGRLISRAALGLWNAAGWGLDKTAKIGGSTTIVELAHPGAVRRFIESLRPAYEKLQMIVPSLPDFPTLPPLP